MERFPWLSPSLDGNPVLWREWHRSRPSRSSLMVALVFASKSILASMFVVVWPGGGGCAFVNGFQVSIGFLLLSVTAATSLAEERARGSLDLILSTPLSTREIVLGKWLGAYRMVPLLAIMPALVIGRGALFRDWSLWWVSLLMIVYVLSAAAITSLGIAMAISCSRLGRAVGVTVSIYILIAVGWFALVMLAAGGPRDRELGMGSPFFWAGEIAFTVTNQPGRIEIGWAMIWTVIWAFVGVSLLRFSFGHFGCRLGRIDQQMALLARGGRSAEVMTKIYLWVAVALGIVAFNQAWAPPAIAFQFTLGLLLVAMRAALSADERHQKKAEEGELAIAANSLWSAAGAWLAAFDRLFVLVIIPSMIMLVINDLQRPMASHFAVFAVYTFSAGRQRS